jgi:hypothetical protein
MLITEVGTNKMLTSTRSVLSDLIPNSLASSSKGSAGTRTNLNNSGTSFAQQLADSLETYFSRASAGSHLQIDISPQEGSNLGSRQFLVTVTDPDSAAGTLMGNGVATAEIPPTGENPATEPITNEVDAYWASQPEAVRVLRTIDDPVERAQMGIHLANQGFAIDPNIMIHRWDPYMTMKIRQGEGYTWVPGIGQNGIPVAPGLQFPSLPSYDPNNPPPGSVRVSTDFAIGLEHTSPGWGGGPSNSVNS